MIEVFLWIQPYVHLTKVTSHLLTLVKARYWVYVELQSRDQHMDKVMLVESLGFNLMSVSMLCNLNMIVIFGKYRCIVLMESDKSLVFEGYRKDDLYVVDFSQDHSLLYVF